MPREYQLKRSGYTLPHNVYMQVNYILRDYERMRNEREVILHSGARDEYAGPNRTNVTGDPTGRRGVWLAALSARVEGIDRAVHDVNAGYGDRIKRQDIEYFDSLGAFVDFGLFRYLLYNPETDREPCRRTWQNFKSELAYHVAKNLLII